MAYALNLDPKQNLSGSMPKPVIAGNQMSLTFYAGSSGVTYSAETSTESSRGRDTERPSIARTRE